MLGKKNIRIYFYFDNEANDIIVLMTDKKEQEGLARKALKIILRNRLRLYRAGEFESQLIFWLRPEDKEERS